MKATKEICSEFKKENANTINNTNQMFIKLNFKSNYDITPNNYKCFKIKYELIIVPSTCLLLFLVIITLNIILIITINHFQKY